MGLTSFRFSRVFLARWLKSLTPAFFKRHIQFMEIFRNELFLTKDNFNPMSIFFMWIIVLFLNCHIACPDLSGELAPLNFVSPWLERFIHPGWFSAIMEISSAYNDHSDKLYVSSARNPDLCYSRSLIRHTGIFTIDSK